MKTGSTVYLKAGDPTDRYFTNIAWSPDDKCIYMFELNRDQNDCRLVCYDANTGEKLNEIYKETHLKASSTGPGIRSSPSSPKTSPCR